MQYIGLRFLKGHSPNTENGDIMVVQNQTTEGLHGFFRDKCVFLFNLFFIVFLGWQSVTGIGAQELPVPMMPEQIAGEQPPPEEIRTMREVAWDMITSHKAFKISEDHHGMEKLKQKIRHGAEFIFGYMQWESSVINGLELSGEITPTLTEFSKQMLTRWLNQQPEITGISLTQHPARSYLASRETDSMEWKLELTTAESKETISVQIQIMLMGITVQFR